MVNRLLQAAVLILSAGGALPAVAEVVKFHADLAPAKEVPPVQDAGSGTAQATLDTQTHMLTYDLSFTGFTAPVTMAHFHGPAPEGVNAGVVVPLGPNPVSPLHGTVTLTPEQQTQLLGGLWYANLHTAIHPKGAARGQMLKQ